jgi:hypothetical protein
MAIRKKKDGDPPKKGVSFGISGGMTSSKKGTIATGGGKLNVPLLNKKKLNITASANFGGGAVKMGKTIRGGGSISPEISATYTLGRKKKTIKKPF